MNRLHNRNFNDLVEKYLGDRLPDEWVSQVDLRSLSEPGMSFLVRALKLMNTAKYPPTSLTPYLVQWLTSTAPNILPDAWGGMIPPLTMPNRHRKLDRYVASQFDNTDDSQPVFLDIGCGFPPLTTAETAHHFSNWMVYGIDRSFSDYVLYDKDQNYACFDSNGDFQYFQPSMIRAGREMYVDPIATRKHFRKLFEELHPHLKLVNNHSSEHLGKEGNKLVYQHIKDYETDNLTFIKSDIYDIQQKNAQVIRTMNVLLYFKPKIREEMISVLDDCLKDNGLLIVGTNGQGVQCRYTIYRKAHSRLTADEFAFGFDNLGHMIFMPWFTLHDNDPEVSLLAELTGVLRNSESFWPSLSDRMDELLKEHEICERGADGFFHFSREVISPAEYYEKYGIIWKQLQNEGYPTAAVRILNKSGYNSWINPVGDLAINPTVEMRL